MAARRWLGVLLLVALQFASPLVAGDGRPFFLPARSPTELPPEYVAPSPPLSPIETIRGPGAYPYGWFGVQPRRQWVRSFGFYRNHTQWSDR